MRLLSRRKEGEVRERSLRDTCGYCQPVQKPGKGQVDSPSLPLLGDGPPKGRRTLDVAQDENFQIISTTMGTRRPKEGKGLA